MKKITLLILLLATAVRIMAATPTAQQVLDNCNDKIKSSMSLIVTYTLTADGHSTDGQLTISGDRFTISSPDMMSWYDGKTQWTYARQIGEVNIITPTSEELQQINPFAIIRSFSANYTKSIVSENASTTTLMLKPQKSGGDITMAKITVGNSSWLPTHITLGLSNGHNVEIAIKKIDKGGALPSTFFRFNKNKFPGVQVVDLR